jgi:molybdenum cofactor cytidylyltransferase
MHPPTTAALVLAAGLSRRFGKAKLEALYRGRPLVAHVLDEVAAALEEQIVACAVVVHRPHDAVTAALATQAGATPVVNAHFASGMASSLCAGLEALAALPEPPRLEGVVILLGDQPLVRRQTIALVIQAAGRSMDLVRPVYGRLPGVPGHPVFVSRRVWDRARTLHGDQGFQILESLGGICACTIPVEGQNPDVDTPADLAALEDTPPHA